MSLLSALRYLILYYAALLYLYELYSLHLTHFLVRGRGQPPCSAHRPDPDLHQFISTQHYQTDSPVPSLPYTLKKQEPIHLLKYLLFYTNNRNRRWKHLGFVFCFFCVKGNHTIIVSVQQIFCICLRRLV